MRVCRQRHALRARGRRAWGLFLPLYAVRSERSWGAGDLSDLAALAAETGRRGGRIVGTLPLLPLFLDRPYDPSPYAPVSRLFWGEFWLDVARVPELRGCRAARRLLESAGFQRELGRLRRAPRVDYRAQMSMKRRVLRELAGWFFAHGAPGRKREFRAFLRRRPEVEEYADFLAKKEAGGMPGQRYHAYAQWLMEEQMRQVADGARRSGVGLYFDLPLGVHPDGYDAWKWSRLFAGGATCGAPPDPFFTRGQDWGFPPLHPQRIREDGYRYFAACLRHSMRHAALLRVDHVMALQRLYWIPKGFPASEGVYVRYPAEELYAVLCRESRRNRCAVVGEDLGTVPAQTRAALARHRLLRMFVVQYELRADPRRPMRPVPSECVASLNTHDMAPFASFWRQAAGRPLGAARMALSLLRRIARSRSRLVLVNPEDHWGELRPHNVPGTGPARGNWTRKARHPLEEMFDVAAFREALELLCRTRC